MKRLAKLFVYLLVAALVFAGAFVITVKLVFRKQEITTPNLVGVSFFMAQKQIQALGCSLHIADILYSKEYAKGVIIAQRIAPGRLLPVGRLIAVDVSKGPQETTLTDFTGMPFDQVAKNLKIKGFTLGRLIKVHSRLFNENTVMAQYPPAGLRLDQNRPVNLLVSNGRRPRKYNMPDLVGMDFAEAQNILDSMNLYIGDIRYKWVKGFPEDIVVNQHPKAGTSIAEREYVDISLNRQPGKRMKYYFNYIHVPMAVLPVEVSLYRRRGDGLILEWRRDYPPNRRIPIIFAGHAKTRYVVHINNHFYKEVEF